MAPALLAAQELHGRVVGPTQPIADAIVTAWGSNRELARTTTSTSGAFALRLNPTDTVFTLAVRAIGFQQRWLPLASVDTARLVVALTPFTLALPELAAQTTARRCPVPDDPKAHQLWQAVVNRYSVPDPSKGMAARVRQWTGTVGLSEVGSIHEAQLYPVLQGTSGGMRQAAATSIDSLGYARLVAPPYDLLLGSAVGNDLYFQWWYPSLDTWNYEQWLAPAFGQRHALAQVTLSGGGIELVFCPRDDRQPGLAGVMHLGSDTALQVVTWEIRTRKPQERPGGRVEFGALGSGQSQLAPVRSVYWRLVGGSKDRYLQRVTVFSRIVISNTDSSPPLKWTD